MVMMIMKFFLNQANVPSILTQRTISSLTTSIASNVKNNNNSNNNNNNNNNSSSSSSGGSGGGSSSSGNNNISTPNPFIYTNLPFSFQFSQSPSYRNSFASSIPTLKNKTVMLTEDDEKNELVLQYIHNRALDNQSFILLASVYAIMILIGAIGNGFVCYAVARQPKMRTSRNLFIINLAISDLLLCFITIPFSLLEISSKFWPYGIVMCKLVLALEATSIFVSTLSITAIALDRYQVILQSMNPKQSHKPKVPQIIKLFMIWIIGILLALPLVIYRTVEPHYIGIAKIDPIEFCSEKWPIAHGRIYYSIFSMLIQYLVPITIVTIVYTRLSMKLRTRALVRSAIPEQSRIKSKLQKRNRKTNLLLISIAIIFCISWLPLNVLNVISDLNFSFSSDKTFRITFAVCHIVGMSSACSNPFIYGWLNQNFRNEFREIFHSLKRSLIRICFCIVPTTWAGTATTITTSGPGNYSVSKDRYNSTITDFQSVPLNNTYNMIDTRNDSKLLRAFNLEEFSNKFNTTADDIETKNAQRCFPFTDDKQKANRKHFTILACQSDEQKAPLNQLNSKVDETVEIENEDEVEKKMMFDGKNNISFNISSNDHNNRTTTNAISTIGGSIITTTTTNTTTNTTITTNTTTTTTSMVNNE